MFLLLYFLLTLNTLHDYWLLSRLVWIALATLYNLCFCERMFPSFFSRSGDIRRCAPPNRYFSASEIQAKIFHFFQSPQKEATQAEPRIRSKSSQSRLKRIKIFPLFSPLRAEKFMKEHKGNESQKLRWSSCMDEFFTFVTSMENPRNAQLFLYLFFLSRIVLCH